MPVTRRKDLIIPEILEEAIQGEFEGLPALFGSDAVIVNGSLPGDARGGDTVKIPYFGNIGELEDLADDEGDEGPLPALTPAKLTMSGEEAKVHHSGKAFEITEWGKMAAMYADPYREAARQIREAVLRRADLALITLARQTPLVLDVATTPVDGLETISYDAVVKGRYLWGDRGASVSSMSLHSKVGADAELLKDGNGKPLIADAIAGNTQRRFAGVPFRLSDKLTTGAGAAKRYEAILAQARSMVFWYNADFEVQTDKDILSDSTVAAVHIYWAAHTYKRMPGSTKPGVAKIITK